MFIPYVYDGKCEEEPKNDVESLRKNNLSVDTYGVSDISLVFVSPPAPQSANPRQNPRRGQHLLSLVLLKKDPSSLKSTTYNYLHVPVRLT